MNEREVAIFKDAVLKLNTLKFGRVEHTFGEDHLPVGAPKDAGAGPSLVGVDGRSLVIILNQREGFQGDFLNSFK